MAARESTSRTTVLLITSFGFASSRWDSSSVAVPRRFASQLSVFTLGGLEMSAQQEWSDNQESAGTTGTLSQGRVVRIEDLAETVQTMVRQAMADSENSNHLRRPIAISGSWIAGEDDLTYYMNLFNMS